MKNSTSFFAKTKNENEYVFKETKRRRFQQQNLNLHSTTQSVKEK